MKEINNIISGLSKSGFLSGLAGGALGGALTNKKGRKKMKKYGGSALKVGALAAVGGLAWKAYSAYKEGNQGQPHTSQDNQGLAASQLQQADFERVVNESTGSGPMLILKAMIAAAYADGHMDNSERQRIFAQVDDLQLSTSDKAALFDSMENPLSLEQLTAQVNNMETAVEVYAASLLAIDEEQTASAYYLHQLAAKLELPAQLVEKIHQES